MTELTEETLENAIRGLGLIRCKWCNLVTTQEDYRDNHAGKQGWCGGWRIEMAAFINALTEEGTKEDCLEWVKKLWYENSELRSMNRLLEARINLIKARDDRKVAIMQIIDFVRESDMVIAGYIKEHFLGE